MSIPTTGWSNKSGTTDRACSCGTWKKHWINFSDKSWPTVCSVSGCGNEPTVGGHVINTNVNGERIVPLCDSCNKRTGTFTLKSIDFFVSANTEKTCNTAVEQLKRKI